MNSFLSYFSLPVAQNSYYFDIRSRLFFAKKNRPPNQIGGLLNLNIVF